MAKKKKECKYPDCRNYVKRTQGYCTPECSDDHLDDLEQRKAKRKSKTRQKILVNFQKRPIYIRHAALRSVEPGSFKVECPFCFDGLFLGRRNEREESDYLKLLRGDQCTSCGRRVLWMDLAQLRRLFE